MVVLGYELLRLTNDHAPVLLPAVLALWWSTALVVGIVVPILGCPCVHTVLGTYGVLYVVAALMPHRQSREWFQEMAGQLDEVEGAERRRLAWNLLWSAPSAVWTTWSVCLPQIRHQVRCRQADRRAIARQAVLARGLLDVLGAALRREPGRLLGEPTATLPLPLAKRAALVAYISGGREDRPTGSTMWHETKDMIRFAGAVSETWQEARFLGLTPGWWDVLYHLQHRQPFWPLSLLARLQARVQICCIALRLWALALPR